MSTRIEQGIRIQALTQNDQGIQKSKCQLHHLMVISSFPIISYLQEILDMFFIATTIRKIAITIYIGFNKPNIKDNLLREKRLDKKYSLLISSSTIFIIMVTLSRIGNMKTMNFDSYKMVC